MSNGERAQSEVIGVVLLLAITIAAVTITVATGSVALGFATDEARSSGVENGMSQLSSQSSLVALGETDARRFDLGAVAGGDLRLDEEAGHVEVRIERENETQEIYNDTIGTLEYRGENRDIALQGGGVWAMQGDRGRMISPPEYHYRGSTLTFPIVRLTGEESSPSSGTGVVRRSVSDPNVVDATDNPLQDGTVVVEVQSTYYEGWYDFFNQRADGDVTKDDANQTTTARLVVPDEVTFERAVSIGGGGYTHDSGGDGLDESAYSEGGTHASVEPLIDAALDDAEDSTQSIEDCVDADPCGSGTYYNSNDVDLGGDIDFDTSDGNITIVIDGDFDLENRDLIVTNEGSGAVKYYINGSVLASGNAKVGTDPSATEAQRNQFYVREGFLEDTAGTPEIDAVVYAPNSDTEISGSVTLRGGFVFNSLTTGDNAFTIEHDESLADLSIPIVGGAGQNPITYLHVSENVVAVDFDR